MHGGNGNSGRRLQTLMHRKRGGMLRTSLPKQQKPTQSTEENQKKYADRQRKDLHFRGVLQSSYFL